VEKYTVKHYRTVEDKDFIVQKKKKTKQILFEFFVCLFFGSTGV
jgi:hypothetical protein